MGDNHPKGRRRRVGALGVALAAATIAAVGGTVPIAEARPSAPARPARPVAPTQAGPVDPQSPFLCTTEFNDLGQPIVDNQERRGTPVYPLTAAGAPDRAQDPLGWSERCQADERVEYRYRTTGGSLQRLAPGATTLPADISYLPVASLLGADRMELGGATQIPYLVRLQRGTLPENRFLYSVAMLATFEEYQANDGGAGAYDQAHWNGRLLFSFDGGVGIGHSQGDLSTGSGTVHEALRLGHAVVYSSGTRTSTHYNLALGGRTALELKARFVAEHGTPTYTVGIGGSGGGIQQYVYAQNHPDLLDAAIPQYSYPDMTTQTINVGDCELLEHYMDVTDASNERWRDWDARKILQGQNTIEGFTSDWQARTGDTGSSECIEGWRGATPLAMNPNFGLATGMDQAFLPYLGEILTKLAAGDPPYPDDFPDIGRLLRVHEDPDQRVEWTHWADVREVYGTDPDTGFARVPWDNVGVQYGLRAVADGTLTPAEFLDLNARVGSWKDPEDTTAESCGMVEAMVGSELTTFARAIGLCAGDHLDQYSAAQMNLGSGAAPAPRRSGDVAAITAAFESGLEFDGSMPREIPIIDARHYLEDQLDMHNAHQSFVIRERIRRAQGDADNQVIWFLDARPDVDDAATDRLYDDGFRIMDRWVRNLQADPGLSVSEAKPEGAVDRCWGTDGTEIAQGDDVWSGAEELVVTGGGAWTGSAPSVVDGVPVGPCSATFPLHSTSRVIAGGPITNDVYKCHLKPVAQAISDGDYGEWTPTAEDRARLEQIHPGGVCDYSLRSVGYPGGQQPPTTTTTSAPPTSTSAAPTSSSTSSVADTSTTADPGNVGSGGLDAGSDDGSGGSLATTGSDVAPFVVTGLLLVGGGAGLIALRRRAGSA